MSLTLSPSAKNAIDQAMRSLTTALYTGGPSQLFQDIMDAVNSGNIGVTASAWDVDGIAKDGGQFSLNADTTSGLTWGHRGGRLYNGKTTITVAAGTLSLSASNTNYVEVSRAGVVSSNTSAFTSGSIPLYVVVTGVGTITSTTNVKCFLGSIPNGGTTGDLLSQIQKTKIIQIPLGTISATTELPPIVLPPAIGKIVAARLVVKTTITANDTNYWTFALVNKTASGSGTTAILAATDANTTKATGGSGLTNYVARALTLHGTAANLDFAASDCTVFTATKTASASNLENAVLELEVTHDN